LNDIFFSIGLVLSIDIVFCPVLLFFFALFSYYDDGGLLLGALEGFLADFLFLDVFFSDYSTYVVRCSLF
jgi:hypothetical protein